MAAAPSVSYRLERLRFSQVADPPRRFEAFAAAAGEGLFGPPKTRGFGFDVALLPRPQAPGYRVAEVPVNWTDQPGSKVGVFGSGRRMLGELVLARLRTGRWR